MNTNSTFPTSTSANALRTLSARILATHHVVVRRDLPQLASKAASLAETDACLLPQLKPIAQLTAHLLEDLLNHLQKEEQILFPYIEQLEAAQQDQRALPHACFASVGQPIAMMHYEHDASATLLAHLAKLTNNYSAPTAANTEVSALYAGLKAFADDLHEHIRVENEELFPGAIALETQHR